MKVDQVCVDTQVLFVWCVKVNSKHAVISKNWSSFGYTAMVRLGLGADTGRQSQQ